MVTPNDASAVEPPAATVRRVILVCKNHLDVGFTESAAKVTHDAVLWMLPVAVQQSRQLRECGGEDNFVWTTPSWTVHEALERHRGRELAQIEQACVHGDLAWHALPFSTHTELMDAELFEFGLSLAQRLDARFGQRTVAAKMTDVPGHTRGMVPILAAAGVQFLHIGVNHMSAVPRVPAAFRWRDPETARDLVVFYDRGYGGELRLPGTDTVLAFRMVGDNMEVPSLPDVRGWLQEARRAFPQAQVAFGRMDDYAPTVATVRDRLPVVEQEIGDTWIHGVGTDPWKTSRFKELLRLRKEWLRDRKLLKDSPAYFTFSLPLLLVAEHTWGVAVGAHLQDTLNLAKPDFQRVRGRGTYRTCEASWQEQRDYVADAVSAAGTAGLANEVERAFDALTPRRPDDTGFVSIDPRREVRTEDTVLRFEPESGALVGGSLRGRTLAADAAPNGWLRYQTLSRSELEQFRGQYCGASSETAAGDFGKPGLEDLHSEARFWSAELKELLRRDEADGTVRLLQRLTFAPEAVDRYGAPADVWVGLTVSARSVSLSWEVQWFGKSAVRTPEALWFSLAVPVADATRWRLRKLGQRVAPLDVVSGGGRKLHACETVEYVDAVAPWTLASLDAPLVAPGSPRFLDFDDALPRLEGGWHFNLWNNVWGTNFPQWCEGDARFRFVQRAELA